MPSWNTSVRLPSVVRISRLARRVTLSIRRPVNSATKDRQRRRYGPRIMTGVPTQTRAMPRPGRTSRSPNMIFSTSGSSRHESIPYAQRNRPDRIATKRRPIKRNAPVTVAAEGSF